MTDKQEETLFTDAVKELVAIGASIASNCEMCFKHHFNEARKLGVSKEDIRKAVEMAQMVKDSPARSVAELADKYLREPAAKAAPCCCGSGDSEPAADGKAGKKSCC
jgi:AhpD family alkylhydroperoxidase